MSKWMHKYKCHMRRNAMESLQQLLESLLEGAQFENDDDKILFALFAEIKDKLYTKMGKFQNDYQISFTPAHALALRVLYTDYINNPTSYLGNKMHAIAMEVHQQYN